MHGLFDVYYHFEYSKILLNLVLSKRFQVLLNSQNICIYSTIRMYSNMIKDYYYLWENVKALKYYSTARFSQHFSIYVKKTLQ